MKLFLLFMFLNLSFLYHNKQNRSQFKITNKNIVIQLKKSYKSLIKNLQKAQDTVSLLNIQVNFIDD